MRTLVESTYARSKVNNPELSKILSKALKSNKNPETLIPDLCYAVDNAITDDDGNDKDPDIREAFIDYLEGLKKAIDSAFDGYY